MERGNNSEKPERKVIEKNRRNQMKFLYSQLFSMLPDNVASKGSGQMSDRVNEAIEYIETLKTNLEKSKDKKEKLLSSKRLQKCATSDSHGASTSQSLEIQIHEMSPDVDVVLISGLKDHLVFCEVVRVLGQYSTEVLHANYSASGPSTFHVHQKKVEAAEMRRRLNQLFGGSSGKDVLDFDAQPCKETEANLDLWDYEICSDVWFRN